MGVAARSDVMSREAFRTWARGQPGRVERVAGVPVAMAPERRAHVRMKQRVWAGLRDGLRQSGWSCEAFVDGLTVEVGEDGDYVPDVLVDCGAGGPDDLVARQPVIVVEILSPGSGRADTGYKLTGYFSVPSIVHYLIVDPDRPAVIHHRRCADGTIATTVLRGGRVELEPPGLTLDVGGLYDVQV